MAGDGCGPRSTFVIRAVAAGPGGKVGHSIIGIRVAPVPGSRSSAMRPFHMILQDVAGPDLRRLDFSAEGPDHAFPTAPNESDGVHVASWQGPKLLARKIGRGACRGRLGSVGE